MINRDIIMDLVLAVDVFIQKKGQNNDIKKKVIKLINTLVGEDSLDNIFINDIDNINIPDVFVMSIYNKDFNTFVMNPDLNDYAPFGYTIEINNKCFEKYRAEQLTAIIIHHILQNVQSSSAKCRFLAAYSNVLDKYKDEKIMAIFDDISHSEITYMMYTDICMRPFNTPISGYNYLGTDDVLRSIGLDDAFDSVYQMNQPVSNKSVEDLIDDEIVKDEKTVKTIINACINGDIHHYHELICNTIPLITINNVMHVKSNGDNLGFNSKRKEFKRRYHDDDKTVNETVMNPENEIELRFQLDKIITQMRYAETEDERAAILFRIKNLSIKLLKTATDIDNRMIKNPADKNLKHKAEYLSNISTELDSLRKTVVEMEIKPKKFGVFVKYPVGYEY